MSLWTSNDLQNEWCSLAGWGVRAMWLYKLKEKTEVDEGTDGKKPKGGKKGKYEERVDV